MIIRMPLYPVGAVLPSVLQSMPERPVIVKGEKVGRIILPIFLLIPQ